MKFKTILLLVLLFPIISNGLKAQIPPTFKLSDTNIYQGQKHILVGLETNFRGNFLKESSKLLDSIIDFLKNNPEVILEIGVHTDYRGNSFANYDLSRQRADVLKFDICKRGNIKEGRIISIGYGEDYPIIPNKYISSFNDNYKKDSLYTINRRIELHILEGYEFNFINYRKIISEKYFKLKYFGFLDSNLLQNQQRVINGVITTLDGKILKDSLGYIDSLANLLENNKDLIVFISDIAHSGECDDIDLELACQRDYYFEKYLLQNRKIERKQVIYVENRKKRNFYSIKQINEMLESGYDYEKIDLNRKFIVEIQSSVFSKQKKLELEKEIYRKKEILKELKGTVSSNWKQNITSYYEYRFEIIPFININLENKKIDIGGVGVNKDINIKIIDKEYSDIAVLSYKPEDIEIKNLHTKSNLIQIWSPICISIESQEVIDEAIYKIEQFFKENYDKL